MRSTVAWPIEDLARRVERALDLAEAAIALVGAENLGIDLNALEAPPDKVITETAMLLRVAQALPETLAPGVSARARELARALVPLARHPRVVIGLALYPALARDYGAAHVVLTNAGFPDCAFDRLLAAAIAAPNASARERLPHRELEQQWLASLVDCSVVSDDLVDRTALGRGVDLLTGSRDDLYALTHALMYTTDFGNRRAALSIPKEHVLATARSALAGTLDDDDFDLAGELLFTWPFLHAEWDATASLVFAVLARVEDEVGVLPSLALDRAAYEQQPIESRQHYVAAVTYHTAYVMGLLCALTLLHQSLPNTQPCSMPGFATFANHLLQHFSGEGRHPQWLEDITRLPEGHRAAYVGFLLDIALRRAVRRLDLARIQQLLQGGIDQKIPLSPLCGQAAGILRRLADGAPEASPGHCGAADRPELRAPRERAARYGTAREGSAGLE